MKKKFFSVLLALVLVCSFSLVTAVPVAAATDVWVDDDAINDPGPGDPMVSDPAEDGSVDHPFDTIQEGITAVDPDGTVHVLAGTYAEDLSISKSLTLSGPNAAISPNTGTRVDEAIIDGHMSVAGAIHGTTIKGFHFEVTPGVKTIDCIGTFDGDDLHILKNSFTADPATNSWVEAIGVHSNPAVAGLVIDDNLVTGVRGIFVNPQVAGSDVTITNNVIAGDSGTPASAGISVDGVTGDISGNVISNTGDAGINVGSVVGPCDGLTISNNTVTNAGNDECPNAGAINLYSDCTDITITGNTLADSWDGITIKDMGLLGSGIAVNFNNITGNSNYGVFNGAAPDILDAPYNWWGSANGPGEDGANDVSGGPVDYNPWLPGTWQTYFIEPGVAINSDGDDFTDLEEYWLGTDPTDAEDYPGAAVEEVASAYAGDGDIAETETTNASVIADAAAGESALVTLAEYAGTPEDESVFGAVGSYVDVHTDTPENLEEVEIRVNYDDALMTEAEELGLRMSYWNSDVGDWRQCSDQGVNTGEDYIWAKIRDDTIPDLSYLTGGPFGGGPASVELDSDWYKTGDTVEVTVEDVAANIDPIRTEEVEVTAKSDTDMAGITVTLTETDVNTAIFEGTFPLVAPPPPEPSADELAVLDEDVIVVAYLGAGYTATVDDTLPWWAISGPSGTIIDATPEIKVNYGDAASGIDTGTVVIKVDGIDVTGSATVTGSDVTYIPSVALSEGEHDVDVDFSDLAGNPPSHSAAWSFTVDTVKPTVGIGLAPSPPYTDVGEITFTLTFNEDMDTGVAPVVTFDAHLVTGGWTDLSLTEWVGTFIIDGTWVLANDGLQILTVSGAKDAPGNEMLVDALTAFIIDLNAPAAPDLVSPGDAAVIEDTTTPEFEWSAVTDVSDVTYQLQVDDAADFLSPELDVSDIEATTYTPTEALANDGYNWRVRAIDGVGNLGEWSLVRTFTQNADAVNPEVTLISPNGGEVWEGGSEQTITWTALDNISTLEQLEFTLSLSRGGDYDEEIGTGLTSASVGMILEAGVFSYTWTVGDYNNTNCRIKVVAVDLQDNTAFDVSNDYFTIGTPVTFDRDLTAGWNLISLPVIPDNTAIGTILATIVDKVDIVWGYDPVNSPDDPWAYYKPGVVEDDLILMVDGMGYWVYMSDLASLTISGIVMPVPPDAPPTYDVASGWNLIGFKSIGELFDWEYLANIAGAYSVLWGYDIDGYFNVYPIGDGIMAPGFGYWLWATQDGVIVPPQ